MVGILGIVGKFAAIFVVTWVIGLVVPHHDTSVTPSFVAGFLVVGVRVRRNGGWVPDISWR
jgi:hypothetical protein